MFLEPICFFQSQLWDDFIICFNPIFLGSRDIHELATELFTFSFRWGKMPPLALLNVPSFVHAERMRHSSSQQFQGPPLEPSCPQFTWIQSTLKTSHQDRQRVRKREWGCGSDLASRKDRKLVCPAQAWCTHYPQLIDFLQLGKSTFPCYSQECWQYLKMGQPNFNSQLSMRRSVLGDRDPRAGEERLQLAGVQSEE